MRIVVIIAAFLFVPSLVLGQLFFSDLGGRGLHSGNTKNKGVPTQTPSQTPTVTPTPTPTAGNTPTPTPTPTGATPTPTAQPTLDVYGGNASLVCGNGSASHFYTQKRGDRWWMCDPLGNVFYLKGVAAIAYNMSAAQSAIVNTKYVSGQSTNIALNWALNQANRLKSWGFNEDDQSFSQLWPMVNQGTASNGWPSSGGYIPTKIASGAEQAVTYHALRADVSGEGPIKEQMFGLPSSAPAGTSWSFYRGYDVPDYFDSHWSTDAGLILAASGFPSSSGTNGGYYSIITIDESDETGFLSASSTTYDTYPATGFANLQAHPGWVTLNSSPVQKANGTWYSGNYSDCNNYTKIDLVNSLITEYGTIAALNSAWGSNYTTFWSSQSGFTGSSNWGSGHPNCTGYTSFGTGTGLMDEGAQDTFSGDPCTLLSSTSSNFTCSTGYSSSTSSFRADMSTFLKSYMDQYYGVLKTAWNTQLPGVLLSMDIGGFGGVPRAETLTEAAKYLDLVQTTTPLYGDPNNQGKLDFIENNLGDRPIWLFVSGAANADSPFSACVYQGNACHYGNPQTPSYEFATQAAKGTFYANEVNLLLNSKSTTYGDYPVAGFYWWAGEDKESEVASYGLVDNQDNAYDGTQDSETPGTDTWGYSTGEIKQQTSWCLTTGDPVPGCTGNDTSSWTNNTLWAGQTACVSNGVPYACCTGSFTSTSAQPCGANYGNFIGPVTTANNGVYSNIPP